ncbi:MAG: carboxypeptidase-like regulatory domain-containing protein, partial [Emticicia sp.]
MKTNSFLFLLLLPSIVFCQGYTSISGKIIDKNTQKGIPHAYLSLPTKGFSSETNSLGEFKFSFPRIDLDSTVIVSVIGYKSFAKKASALDSISIIE